MRLKQNLRLFSRMFSFMPLRVNFFINLIKTKIKIKIKTANLS